MQPNNNVNLNEEIEEIDDEKLIDAIVGNPEDYEMTTKEEEEENE